MDALVTQIQKLPPAALPEQKEALAALLSLEDPLPPYLYVEHASTALGTQEGIDALRRVNPNFNDLSARLVQFELENLGATSFIVINQNYNLIMNTSAADQFSEAVSISARTKQPVLLFMGGALQCVTGSTTREELFSKAGGAKRILQSARDFRRETLEAIRSNNRLQQYLADDFGLKPELREQLLALPDVEEIGIANCDAGAIVRDFATQLKDRAEAEGIPICFAAHPGGTAYLFVIHRDSDIDALFAKLQKYSNEARELCEERLDEALKAFFEDPTLDQPEEMLAWLRNYNEQDLHIVDTATLDDLKIRSENLGYRTELNAFEAEKLNNFNELTAYLMGLTADEVDRLIIAHCLHEILGSGTLISSIRIPRKDQIRKLLNDL